MCYKRACVINVHVTGGFIQLEPFYSPTVEDPLPALGQMQESRIVHGTRQDCTICVQHSDEAVKFCQDCKATFCENHVRDHYQASGLMKHTLVEATEGRKTVPNVDHHVHETYVETEQTATQVEFPSSPVK
jgi:hypothetical protein